MQKSPIKETSLKGYYTLLHEYRGYMTYTNVYARQHVHTHTQVWTWSIGNSRSSLIVSGFKSLLKSCSAQWVMAHVWMRCGAHMNESCHTHEWVMSHIWMSPVAHMNESCRTHEWVMSHIWMSHVTYMIEPRHTYERVISWIWMPHVTHMRESWHTLHICMRHELDLQIHHKIDIWTCHELCKSRLVKHGSHSIYERVTYECVTNSR